ncbi:hypothetical protein SAMN05216388_100886 [Halorientalis persicus]|jgi:hypothetical protein|uniref:Uncharacterized protein n=1 Tax=Halorientalis persicus TaxID=1367881 RepID=A0A1H8M1J0_9EURY|nr:hypothetical protein [Halorientalis persicus]SEO11235.1 hypothetical protein SAMN05216388_100886 [Halorientalis persicus]
MDLTYWGAGHVALVGAVCLSAVLYIERPVVGAIVGLLGASAILHAAYMIRTHRAGKETQVGF